MTTTIRRYILLVKLLLLFYRYPLEQMLALMRLHMPLLRQLMRVTIHGSATPGKNKGPWFQNFATQAVNLLEDEYFTQETMKWTTEVAEALQPCAAMLSVASIVMDWTKAYNAKCLEKLAFLELEINDLVARNSENQTT
jgi:hypothetical protein